MRCVTVATLVFVAVSAPAFADTIAPDPVFFCNAPASECSGDPNTVTTTTSFGMFKNGSGTSSDPWDLLLAIPNYVGSAPTIASDDGFTPGVVKDDGKYLPTEPGGTSLYDFAGLIGDGSMNVSNLFGTAEQTVFDGIPNYFEIFDYVFTPGFDSQTAYSFAVGGSGLPNGTFLAASGGSNPFSTPFTTTGLIDGQVPDGGATLMLLGMAVVGLGMLRSRLGGI